MVQYDRTFWVTGLAVAAFAGCGALIRTALSLIPLGDAPSIYSLIPNLVGTLILGFTKGAAPSNKFLASGIGTGLCGSITTFSSFSYELNMLFVSDDPDPLWAILFTAITFIGSAIMFFVGESAAKFVCKSLAADSRSTTTNNNSVQTKEQTETQIEIQDAPKPQANMPVEVMGMVGNAEKGTSGHVSGDESVSVSERKETDPVTKQGRADQKEKAQKENEKPATEEKTVCNKVIGIWVGVFVLMNAITIPLSFLIDNKLWLATLLAPLGAFSRWYLGKLFNGKWSIPIGTLIANLFGSILLMALLVCFHESNDPLEETIWIEAVTKGFCGCLSTVSSFVGELFALKRKAMKARSEGDEAEEDEGCDLGAQVMASKMSVLYFAITVVGAQLLDIIPNGIDVWS